MHALDFWLAITRYILTSKIPSNFPHPRYERTYRPHISSARRGKWLEKFHVTRGISTWTTAFTKCERVCVSKRHAYKEIGTPPPCRHEAVLFSSSTGMCRVCVCVCVCVTLNLTYSSPTRINFSLPLYISFIPLSLYIFESPASSPCFQRLLPLFVLDIPPLFPPPTSVRYPAFAR